MSIHHPSNSLPTNTSNNINLDRQPYLSNQTLKTPDTYPNTIPIPYLPFHHPQVAVLSQRLIGRSKQSGAPVVLPLFSVFVDNLGVEVENSILRRTFYIFGKVMDVYVPRNVRNGRPTRFDFVRFFSPHEAQLVAHRSNGQWCLGRPMQVRMVSHERRQSIGPTMPAASTQVMQLKPPGKMVDPKGGKSFSEAVSGVQAREMSIQLVFKEEIENAEWLESRAIAWVRDPEAAIPLNRFKNDGMDIERITSLGEDAVLIFKNRTSMKAALEDENADFGRCFSLVKAWAPDLMKKERVLWLRCRGIPIQLWGVSLFQPLGNACWTFISVHDNTFLKQDLEIARILLSTESMMKIHGSVSVSWRDFQFQVSMEEEMLRPAFAGIELCRGGPNQNREDDVFLDSSGDLPAEMNQGGAIEDTRSMLATKRVDAVRWSLSKLGEGGMLQVVLAREGMEEEVQSAAVVSADKMLVMVSDKLSLAQCTKILPTDQGEKVKPLNLSPSPSLLSAL